MTFPEFPEIQTEGELMGQERRKMAQIQCP